MGCLIRQKKITFEAHLTDYYGFKEAILILTSLIFSESINEHPYQ